MPHPIHQLVAPFVSQKIYRMIMIILNNHIDEEGKRKTGKERRGEEWMKTSQ